eukprot:1194546-Prorocentrum_minimum.AAC.4
MRAAQGRTQSLACHKSAGREASEAHQLTTSVSLRQHDCDDGREARKVPGGAEGGTHQGHAHAAEEGHHL